MDMDQSYQEPFDEGVMLERLALSLQDEMSQDEGAVWEDALRQRKAERPALSKAGRLRVGKAFFRCRVLNMSRGGMMVEAARAFRFNEPVEINLPEAGTFSGRVVWVQNGRAGVAFDYILTDDELARRREAALAAGEDALADSSIPSVAPKKLFGGPPLGNWVLKLRR